MHSYFSYLQTNFSNGEAIVSKAKRSGRNSAMEESRCKSCVKFLSYLHFFPHSSTGVTLLPQESCRIWSEMLILFSTWAIIRITHEQKVSNRRQLKLQKDLNWQNRINPRVTCWKQHFFSLPMLAIFPNFIYTAICPGYFQKLQITRTFGSFQKP